MNFAELTGALTVWAEARGEGVAGESAVAHVLVNRVNAWHIDLEHICRTAWQFSCWNMNDPNRGLMIKMDINDLELQGVKAVMMAALGGKEADPTLGALYYLNYEFLQRQGTLPSWLSKVKQTVKIGNHTFYK